MGYVRLASSAFEAVSWVLGVCNGCEVNDGGPAGGLADESQ